MKTVEFFKTEDNLVKGVGRERLYKWNVFEVRKPINDPDGLFTFSLSERAGFRTMIHSVTLDELKALHTMLGEFIDDVEKGGEL